MPSLVNRLPVGLLSLLGIKSTGLNPSTLLDEVRPTVDLSQYYLSDTWENTFGLTAAANAPGLWAATAIAPPRGQLWVYDDLVVSVTSNLLAGTTYRVRPIVFDVASSIVMASATTSVTFTAGEQCSIGFGRPVIIRPGETAGAFVEAVTLGTAVALRLSGRLARLTQ